MLYTLTIGVAAFLLFLVQPLVSKMLLPWFGGGASIWITSLVFFQTMLLLGYAMTHFVVRHFGLRKHLWLTGTLLAVSLLFLPVAANVSSDSSLPPSLHLLSLLFLAVGLPYLMLATTSPTLQYWMANDLRTRQQSPYLQYGVSNAGSLLGLLTYPFALEIWLSNSAQSYLWSGLFIAYAVLIAATMALYLAHNRSTPAPAATESNGTATTHDIRLKWIFQAMVPSALLLVTTHYLTQDVVNLPLLWVAPLCLYLVTFILCFLLPGITQPGQVRALIGVSAILFLLIANQPRFDFGFGIKILAALTCLFCICMTFHGDLERGKPHKQDLTDFYLQVAAGGALGSILVGILAPLLFKSTFEFYVVLVVALYYVIATQLTLRKPLIRLFQVTVGVSLTVSFVISETTIGGPTLYQGRSFYSTYAVRQDPETETVHRLVAGTHVHGEQHTSGPLVREPLTYYHDSSGVYLVFKALDPLRVGAVGLGIGAIAMFGDADTSFDFYELDPLVVDIAREQFTALSGSPATIRHIVGDGRINLRSADDASYDLLVLDAFTSGSIPAHLVTLEAIEELLQKLAADGAIAYHISNHHIDLLPVLNAIAGELDLTILVHESIKNRAAHKYSARWVLLTHNADLARTMRDNSERWRSPPGDAILWRDDFSNIWSVLRRGTL